MRRVSPVLQQRTEELSKLCKIMEEQTCPSIPGTIHALVLKVHVLGTQPPSPVLGKLGWLVTLELVKLEFESKNLENECRAKGKICLYNVCIYCRR